MSKPFTPKVVTANALLEGDVVYLDPKSEWVRDIQDADVVTDQASAELKLLEAEARSHEVVGAYLANVAIDNGSIKTTHFRETFRTRGPSNYRHGKQAELN